MTDPLPAVLLLFMAFLWLQPWWQHRAERRAEERRRALEEYSDLLENDKP